MRSPLPTIHCLPIRSNISVLRADRSHGTPTTQSSLCNTRNAACPIEHKIEVLQTRAPTHSSYIHAKIVSTQATPLLNQSKAPQPMTASIEAMICDPIPVSYNFGTRPCGARNFLGRRPTCFKPDAGWVPCLVRGRQNSYASNRKRFPYQHQENQLHVGAASETAEPLALHIIPKDRFPSNTDAPAHILTGINRPGVAV